MTGLTAALAAFVHQPDLPAQLPPEAVRIIKTGFADTLATLVAGREVRDFISALPKDVAVFVDEAYLDLTDDLQRAIKDSVLVGKYTSIRGCGLWRRSRSSSNPR